MPHINNWENNGLLRIFEDHVTAGEVVESNLKLHGNHRFDSIRYVVNDFTRISSFEVTEHDIDLIAAVDNAAALTNKNLRIAIVSTNEELIDWLRLYCENMESSPYACNIYTNLDEAYAWVS